MYTQKQLSNISDCTSAQDNYWDMFFVTYIFSYILKKNVLIIILIQIHFARMGIEYYLPIIQK